jgi:hypothetical protein
MVSPSLPQRPLHAFDVIILDVAPPAHSLQNGAALLELLGPTEAFHGDDVLGGHVWNTLRPTRIACSERVGRRWPYGTSACVPEQVRCLACTALPPALLYRRAGGDIASVSRWLRAMFVVAPCTLLLVRSVLHSFLYSMFAGVLVRYQ